MQWTSEAILDAALQLPEGERWTLVSRLLEAIPAEDFALSVDDPAPTKELDRRFADWEGSTAWSDLQAES